VKTANPSVCKQLKYQVILTQCSTASAP